MKATKNRTRIITGATTAILGMALIGLVSCSSGESTSSTPPPGGRTGQSGLIAFVNNRGIGGQNTLSVVGIDSQGNLTNVSTMGAANEFGSNALGDMQFSNGDWVFVNIGASNSVATIDPLSRDTPIHEDTLLTGTRPVHIYRDPTDGERIWSMNDGDPTNGNDSITCGGVGTSVTVLKNSHIGIGGTPPSVVGTTCTLAAGHGVAAFSRPTQTDGNIPKYAVVTNAKGGQMAFIDNNQASSTYRKMVARLDLCANVGQAGLTPPGAACDDETPTALTVPFTPNGSSPHGIRWSKQTGKIYSMQTGYSEIIEVDPKLIMPGPGHNQPAVTRRLSLAGTPYASYGITPDGKFLFLRGRDITSDVDHIIGKLAVVDLTASSLTIAALPDLMDVVPSIFKFTPDGQRMYLLAADAATGTGNQLLNQKKNRLFVFNPSAFPVVPTPIEIALQLANGHNFDVLIQGSGQANGVLVSNGTAGLNGLVSFINANNQLIGNLVVGLNPGAVMVYQPGAATAGNQATASLTSGGAKASPQLSDQLDDHGMPE